MTIRTILVPVRGDGKGDQLLDHVRSILARGMGDDHGTLLIRQLLQAGPGATDGKPLRIQKPPYMPDQLDLVPLVVPSVSPPLNRFQLREFLLPVPKDMGLDFA